MTSLIRARGATSEITRLFDADADFELRWRDVIWPGDCALVVTEEGGGRRLSALRWSLPALAFGRPVPAKQRGTLFVGDLVDGGRLDAPDRLRRCLIVLEAFAHPWGQAGHRTRSWFGLSDRPLAAWAGFCMGDGSGCAGLLMSANQMVAAASNHMPRLLAPQDHTDWLGGIGLLSLSETANEYYHENFGERWSTGALLDAPQPAASAFAGQRA